MTHEEKAVSALTVALRDEWWEREEGWAETEERKKRLSALLRMLKRCMEKAGMEVTHEVLMGRVQEALGELELWEGKMERVQMAIDAHRYMSRGEIEEVAEQKRRIEGYEFRMRSKQRHQFMLAKRTQQKIAKKVKEAEKKTEWRKQFEQEGIRRDGPKRGRPRLSVFARMIRGEQ